MFGLEWGRLIDIATAIVAVAGVSVVVGSPYTSGIVNAFGNAFSNSLQSAKK